MTRKWMLIPLAMLIALIPALGCMEEGAPPDETAAKIASLQAKADANAALITQLQSRVSTVEGRAAGEVTQGELDALAAKVSGLESTIADLEAQIVELSEQDGTPSNPDVDVVEMTRWRIRPSFAIYGANAENVAISLLSIQPQPIREPDVYSISMEIENKLADPIEVKDISLQFTLEPSGNVYVSEMTDTYQLVGPYNIWWNTIVRTLSSSGVCRYITIDADPFDLQMSASEKMPIKLEFELVYGE